MGKYAKALVSSWLLLFTIALFPVAALADFGDASHGLALSAGAAAEEQADAGSLLDASANGLVTHSTHVALIQEGATPTAAQAGTPWDGMAVDGVAGVVDGGVGDFSEQALNGVDTAKSRILKALMDVRQGEIYLYDCGIPSNDISDIYASVINSHPDLFYVSGSMGWSSQSTDGVEFIVTSITPSYSHDVATIKSQMKPAYDNAFRDMLSWVPQGAGPIEKAKAVHDWLVRNCAYNTDAANQGYYSYSSKTPWEAYGALVEKRPVCQGYALAFKAAMNVLGVPCGYLTAHDHGWNIIQYNDSWFHVDATWDDPLPDGGFYSVHTEYFMKSDSKVLAVDQARGSYVHADWTQPYHAYDTTYDGWTTGWPSFSGAASLSAPSSLSLSATSMWMLTDAEADLYVSNLSALSYGVFRAQWFSSNSDIVAVDSSGHLVSGSKIGEAQITCRLGGLDQTCIVTVRQPLETAQVSLPQTSYAFTGSAIAPVPKVVVDGVTLVHDKDYTVTYENNTQVGTATVYVDGIGYYTGQQKLSFAITRASLASAAMSSISNQVYNGQAFKPAPVVTLGGKTLRNGIDYALSYKNNTTAGTATVTATGMGDYTGSVSKTFTIAKAANSAKAAATSKSTTFKANKKTRKLSSAKTVALPKVSTKVGTAKWKVVTKDKKGVLSLKSGKIKVKKGAKRGTYTIKLKAVVAASTNYKSASTGAVTVKVRVK